MKVYLDTIGCRLNQAEIESYARQFHAAGHDLVAHPQEADLAVINTCTVTSEAASDSRQKVRQLSRAGVGEIVVTGCWATLSPQEAAALPGVRQIVPNAIKDRLVPDLLHQPLATFELQPVERQLIPGARLRTRAFIKVQDGCDNHCTFCVTTLARGAGLSRSIGEVMADIHAACKATRDHGSAKEIVLTGVHLGSWGQDFSPRLHLRHLVQAIIDESDVPRIRLSSLEPWDLDVEFFTLWENPRLSRQLHLPLQSGCAATLRRMARKTTPQAYADLVTSARKSIPGVAITTDVMAGFPGETEAEFEESLAFLRTMSFAAGHAFTYSARPGTAAAHMPDQVAHEIRKERNARIRAVFAESSLAYQQDFLGQVLPVLWENAFSFEPSGWQVSGLTDNYLRVKAVAPRHLWNEITQVRLAGATEDGMIGEIVS